VIEMRPAATSWKKRNRLGNALPAGFLRGMHRLVRREVITGLLASTTGDSKSELSLGSIVDRSGLDRVARKLEYVR
jgi:hypothetical protein